MLHALVANENLEKSNRPPDIVSTIAEKEQESHLIEPSKEASVARTPMKKRPSLTPSPSTSAISIKRSKLTENFDEQPDEELPRFLSRTKDIFQETIRPLLSLNRETRSINIEQLRKIALLKFYMAINNLDISLWNAYLQSGTGKYEEQQQQKQQQATSEATTTHPKFRRWPSDLKDKMIQHGFLPTDTNRQNITDDAYMNYINQQIRQLRNKNADYNNELKLEKESLTNVLTSEIEASIDQFVEQYGTSFHRVPTNGQISAIEYAYRDRLLELAFIEENPYEYPLEMFRKLSERKYTKEHTKMNVAVLKQRLVYNHLPSSFESLHIPEPISIDTIHNFTVRQRLNEQYHKVAQRTKSDMLRVYIAAEQAKADEYAHSFNELYEEMKENQRTGPLGKRLTSTMLHLLQQRLANINKHIMYVYNLKIDFFAKAPTGKN